VAFLFQPIEIPRRSAVSFSAMASTVSKFTDNDIEVKGLVKSWQPQWRQVQLPFTWSDVDADTKEAQ
jgi:hypothetical protein